METVTEQRIKKIEFFRCPQSLPGVAPLTKKPEDSGYEIEQKVEHQRESSVLPNARGSRFRMVIRPPGGGGTPKKFG